jgi:hypothetical protein
VLRLDLEGRTFCAKPADDQTSVIPVACCVVLSAAFVAAQDKILVQRETMQQRGTVQSAMPQAK